MLKAGLDEKNQTPILPCLIISSSLLTTRLAMSPGAGIGPAIALPEILLVQNMPIVITWKKFSFSGEFLITMKTGTPVTTKTTVRIMALG
ncbi:MAG: hypothetical protein AB1611_05075 [bacterium]